MSEQNPFREAVLAWLEAAGWSFPEEQRDLRAGTLGGDEFRWIALGYREPAGLVLAEPAGEPARLILSHHFRLEPGERDRLEQLGHAERTQLAWDLLSHLNLLRIEYRIDGPVPDEVMLSLSVSAEGLTRDLLLRRVERLGAALRLVSIAYAKALGRLLEAPPAPVVH